MDYMEMARNGEAMRNLAENEDFRVFRTEILDKIRDEAFVLFTKVPAEDVAGIIEAQQMRKIVDLIDIQMIDLVEQGRLALDNIKNSNPEEDGGGGIA